jgi:hypothetical protein
MSAIATRIANGLRLIDAHKLNFRSFLVGDGSERDDRGSSAVERGDGLTFIESSRSDSSDDTNGGKDGIKRGLPQPGQRTFFPAKWSGAANDLPH